MDKIKYNKLNLHNKEKGVVLLMAMILLILISLLTATSIRNSISTEKVIGNVRTMELANQAAELALRHCEASVLNILRVKNHNPSTYNTTFMESNILASSSGNEKWKQINIWNSNSTDVFVLPLELVNQNGMLPTYKRSPECMVENISILLTNLPVLNNSGVEVRHNGTFLNNNSVFIITARGFGPEVSNTGASRIKPQGSEVWLQSQIELDNKETSILE